MLGKIGINPIVTGLRLIGTYEEGVVFRPDVLDIDFDAFRSDLIGSRLARSTSPATSAGSRRDHPAPFARLLEARRGPRGGAHLDHDPPLCSAALTARRWASRDRSIPPPSTTSWRPCWGCS